MTREEFLQDYYKYLGAFFNKECFEFIDISPRIPVQTIDRVVFRKLFDRPETVEDYIIRIPDKNYKASP